MLIRTILNNNSVRTLLPDGSPAIVVGRGVGYRKRQGEEIDESLIEQTFIPRTREALGQLVQMLQEIPLEHVRLAAEITDLAIAELGVEGGQALLLPIADHLNFAIRRAEQGIHMEHPLRWEIQTLYPKEAALGRQAVRLINARLRCALPSDEAVAFAMHFVNAQFSGEGMERAFAMTRTIQRVFELVQTTLGRPVDQESMSAARFVTHLRYLFVRLNSGTQLQTMPTELLHGITNAHPLAASVAKKVALLIELGNPVQLTAEEVAYLTLHVARLIADLEGEAT
jgi:beta-glucoside operon transcriptional antiterminator